MARAMWRGQVLAESEDVEIVEGNVYFPRAALDPRFLRASATTTLCGWKGTAHYYTLVVDGAENPDAAWYYPDPKPEATAIRDHVAFWRGVTVER